MGMGLKGGAALAACVSYLALMAAPAHAQEAQAEEEAFRPGFAEIVVTAQRRAETIQDVPLAVSAFSQDSLAAQQIDNTLQLQQALPNTTFTQGNFSGANLSIRGIGSPVVATSADAGVAVHFNDAPLLGSYLFNIEFFDLERLEVLRGPQGTLFGRNATGGVVNIITAKPTREFAASGEVQYGSFEAFQAKGMVNVGLGDIGGIRLAGIYTNREGYTTNLNTGNDVDGRDSYSLRGSILLEPTDATRLTVTAQYFKEDSNRSRVQKQLCARDATGILGCRPDALGFDALNGDTTLFPSIEFLAVATGGAFAPYGLGSVYGDDGDNFTGSLVPTDLRTVAIDFEPIYQVEQFVVQGELSHDFGGVTAYINGLFSDSDLLSEVDYNQLTTRSALPYVARLNALAAGGDPIAAAFLRTPLFQNGQICVSQADTNSTGVYGGFARQCANNTTEFDRSTAGGQEWSIEGRLISDFDGPINFLIGGNYTNVDSEGHYYVNATTLDLLSLALGTATALADPAVAAAVVGGAQPFYLPSPYFDSENFYELRSYGIFGEVYLELSDTLKITGGLRYSNDKKSIRDRQPLLGGIPVQVLSTTDARAAVDALDKDPSTPGVQAFRQVSDTFDALTGRVVIDWKPDTSFSDDTLVYASYSRGYKAGGFNPPFDPTLFSAPTTFQNEIVNAFEIGTKNSFANGAFIFNLTAFYYDYKDFQVSRIINRTSFNDNTDASTWGIEAEAIISPVPDFTINMTASYLKTEIKDLQVTDTRDPSGGRDDVVIIKDLTSAANCAVIPNSPGTIPLANTVALVDAFNANLGGLVRPAVPVPGTNAFGAFSLCTQLGDFINAAAPGAYQFDVQPSGGQILPGGAAVDLSGNELLNSPNWKFAVGAQYRIDMGGGWSLTPRADLNFTGNFFATNFNTPVDKIDAYEIVNAQITLASPDDRFYARAFIQNAFDTDAETGRYVTDPSSGLFTNTFLTEPRRYGFALGFRY